MSIFIDIHRLDYVNPDNIGDIRELKKFCDISARYRCMAADFIIRNNLLRHGRDGHAIALRILFEDIWEWHIPEELSAIINQLRQCWFKQNSSHWDCLWMLKSTVKNGEEFFYSDIIFFGDEHINTEKLEKTLNQLNSDREYITRSVLLAQTDSQTHGLKQLQKLCSPGGNGQLLQCKFAHDITF